MARLRAADWLALLLLLAMLQKQIGPQWDLAQPGDPAGITRLSYYPAFLVSAFAVAMLAANLRRLGRSLLGTADVLLFIGFAIVRQALMPDTVPAVLAAVNYLEIYAALAIFRSRFGPAALVRTLFYVCLYLLAANLAALAVPDMSVMRGEVEGAYRGFTSHRNVLAMIVNLAFAVALASDGRNRWLRLAAVAACLVLLRLAGSVQAAVMTVAATAVFLLYRLAGARPRLRAALAAIAVGIGLAGALLLDGDTAMAWLGRDGSFSGRDRIWDMAWYLIDRAPPLGYGMNPLSPLALEPGLAQGFGVGTAFGSSHSSYLEAVLAFGWGGAALFLLMVTVQLALVLSRLLSRTPRQDALPVSLTLFCVVGGLIEAQRLFEPGIGWITFVVARLLLLRGRLR